MMTRVDGIVAAFERRDASRLAELVHPDVVIHPVPSPTPLLGKTEVASYISSMERRAGAVSVTAVHELSNGAVLITGREQYQDTNGGLFDHPVVWIVEFRDGLIWRSCSFLSHEAALTEWAGPR
jgi:ketosteroid isomerase-like protein